MTLPSVPVRNWATTFVAGATWDFTIGRYRLTDAHRGWFHRRAQQTKTKVKDVQQKSCEELLHASDCSGDQLNAGVIAFFFFSDCTSGGRVGRLCRLSCGG